MTWIQQDAVLLCVELEAAASRHRCHVALTGGLLYKEGQRKDCDIIVYFEGKKPGDSDPPTFAGCVNRDQLLNDFALSCQLVIIKAYARVVKCSYQSKPVDLIFPDLDGEYSPPKGGA